MSGSDDNLRLHLLRSVAVLLLVYVVTVFAIHGETQGFSDWSAIPTWKLLLIGVFIACYSGEQWLIYRENSVWLRRLLWTEAALILLLHFDMAAAGILLPFIAFWIARTPYSYPLHTCVKLAVGALVFYLSMYFLFGNGDLLSLLTLAALATTAFFFVLALSYTTISLRQQRQRALALNRELQSAQLLLAQSARSSERLRIARDIHDLLGHQMTALILHLEIAKHKSAGDSLAQVERALALARMLLSDLRNAVSDMREDPTLDFDSALAELLANVPQLKVTLEREAELVIHDPHTAEVLLRCVQEALTNTLRHANARHSHIFLYLQNGQVVLDIRDDGRSARPIVPGNGLNGMQERFAALAGSLDWYNDQGSFRLLARLPLAEAA